MKVITRLPFVAAAGASALLLAGCSGSATLPLLGTVSVNQGSGNTTPSSQPATSSNGSVTSDLTQIAKKVAPSVVEIKTAGGLGSGVVYDKQGDIVTNAHVVGSGRSFSVTTSDGQKHSASLVGKDAQHDIAVIRISDSANLQPATFADSTKVQVGEAVAAFGSPYGLQGTMTEGIVSALDRTESEGGDARAPSARPGDEQGGATLSGLIQTSAAINPGNSGGALVNMRGEVVGIPTLGASDANGLGFAINSNEVVSVANQLIRNGGGD